MSDHNIKVKEIPIMIGCLCGCTNIVMTSWLNTKIIEESRKSVFTCPHSKKSYVIEIN